MAALLPGIPGLKDGVAALGFGHQPHGTAREVDQNYLFATLAEPLEDLALDGRKFDAGAVAPAESGYLHLHFLSLEPGRNAARENHVIHAAEVLHQVFLCHHPGSDSRCNQGVSNPAGIKGTQVRETLLQAFQQGDGLVRNGVVVAPHHFHVVAVGSDQGHARIGRQGQDGIPVLQEDQGFPGHLAGQFQVFGTLDDLFRQVVPGRFPVHLAQAEAGGQEAEEGFVDGGLVFVAAGYRFGQMLEMVAAFQVDAVVDGVGNGGQRVFGPMVVGIEVFDPVAVGGNDAFKAPFFA